MYEFKIIVQLKDPAGVPEQYLAALRDAGCDDTLVGIGRPGTIGLAFTREADTLRDAIHEAIGQVKAAIPEFMRIQILLRRPARKGASALQTIGRALAVIGNWADQNPGSISFIEAFETLTGETADSMAVNCVRALEDVRHYPDPLERVLCYRLPAMTKEEMDHLLGIVHDYENYHYCLFTVQHPVAGDFVVICAGDQEAVEQVQADLEAWLPRLPTH